MVNKKDSVVGKVLKLDGTTTRFKWIYDRAESLIAYFLGLFGLSFTALIGYLTDTVKSIGYFWLFILCSTFGLISYASVLMSFYMSARSRKIKAETDAIQHWKESVDTINPLDAEFIKKRIKISDLVSPIDGAIRNKRFIDCELIGPANISFLDSEKPSDINGIGIYACDIVMIKDKTWACNVIVFDNITILNCKLHRITLYIQSNMVNIFKTKNKGENRFVTLTGDAELDNSVSLPPQ
jgi:hypothetical protein